ncbi:MAG: hypothetical protein ACE148_11980 [Vicinamibacterales bacterium]
MKTSLRRSSILLLVVGVLISGLAPAAFAQEGQEGQSASLARELASILDQRKLDAIAAKDPAQEDFYYAALYFPGSQLLVVGAKYSVPVLLDEKLAKREFREAYIDLNSASVPASKIFVVDLGVDGLKASREENQPYDTYEEGPKRLALDGDWKKQQIASEADYLKAYRDADARYARMLKTLIGQAKRGS